MSEKKNKKINYKRRANLFKFLGSLTIAITTIGGFVFYESLVDWENFQREMQDFVVVQEETAQLNMTLAMPMLIGVGVFLFIMMRKNREFFKDKASLSLIIVTGILYLLYSVIEVTLFSLVGATIGVFIDEFGFRIFAKKNAEKVEIQKDYDKEYEREKRRILARQDAEKDLDGSV